MDRYGKGARAERELLSRFKDIGYSVIRSAGSGINSISPDIIAIKNKLGFAFECKAWSNGSLSIDHEKFAELKKWEDNTMLNVYMAWKVNNDGWYFIKLNEMSKNEKSYTVTMKTTREINRRFEHIFPEDINVLNEKFSQREQS
jgi:Holliday junction resolvase